jgi:hypothetical protein
MLKNALKSIRRGLLKSLGISGLHETLTAQQSAILKQIEGINHRMSEELDAEWLRKLYPGLSLDEIRDKLSKHAEAEQSGRMLLLHYPPSYELKPRWGYSRPVHRGLSELFARHAADYERILTDLSALLPNFQQIRRCFFNDSTGEPGWMGGAINPIDTGLLYHFVTKLQPKTYLEIGSGLTTLFAARAKADRRLRTRIVSVDPDPRAEVDARCDEVIRAPLELCDLSLFDRLEPGDIVFMDGSHISLMNSDVTVFMLDVVPKLKPGVVIHVHDVHLPYDYPDMFLKWYWHEQYILASYLLGAAERIEVLMPSRYAAEGPNAPELLRPLIDSGLADSPAHWLSGGSLWFTHTK